MIRPAATLLTFVAATLGLGCPDGPTRRPNIVLILADDAGYNEFSMQGSTTIQTPRIDSIARRGVRFTQGYVSGSACSPSRAGLLTGRYQQRFGHEFNVPPVYRENAGLPLGETLVPEILRTTGYRTIAIGKWHLGYAARFHPMERGFTDYYGFLHGGRSYFALAEPPRLERLLRDRDPAEPEAFGYLTDHLAREAASYIARHREDPFFLYLAFSATHTPHEATEIDLRQADGNPIAAMTIALDRAVGVVLDELAKHDLTEDTLVVFLNDNGGARNHDNAPLRGKKGDAWEGGIRVPFAMQWPAVIPAERVYEQPVIALDLVATFAAAARVNGMFPRPLDGVDLLPFLTERRSGRPHQTLFWKGGERWAVRDGDLKLVVGGKGQRGNAQLFDLSRDVSERDDLTESRPEDVERLRALYEDWKSTHRPTPWRRGGESR